MARGTKPPEVDPPISFKKFIQKLFFKGFALSPRPNQLILPPNTLHGK
jgi:hypothetical protein